MEPFDLKTLNRETFSPKEHCLDLLHQFGLFRIRHFLAPSECTSLIAEYQSVTQIDSEELTRRGNKTSVAYSATDLIPIAKSLFPIDALCQLASNYLGSGARFDDSIDFIQTPKGFSSSEMKLHFGVVRKLRFLIYLTEATEKSGCFYCQPCSHLKTQELQKKNRQSGKAPSMIETQQLARQQAENVIPVVGEPGTLIAFDTDLFHRASVVATQERLIIRSQCLLPPPKTLRTQGIARMRRILSPIVKKVGGQSR